MAKKTISWPLAPAPESKDHVRIKDHGGIIAHMRTILLVGLFPAAVPTTAQHANIWYFGDRAGIDFNSGAPVALVDGMMRAYEGCSSICDDNGDLLFYTNGGPVSSPNWLVGAVYDRNHNVMPNGDLTSGGGCNSATQGSLIVQDPGNADHYYIFTTDCTENSLAGGLRYCEVDMTLNGGLGDVTTIGTPVQASVHEAMVGIRHANGTDVWVLVHGTGNNQYHAFLVSASGIAAPVTTSIGPSQGLYTGQLAASLSGTKVHYGTTTTSTLMDFDPATGVLSDLIDLGHASVTGGAFDSGGRYLYTCEYVADRRIYQYDLLAADIPASEVIIGTGNTLQLEMQRGPDGKIYVARNHEFYLGVINHPELGGLAADYQDEGFFLNNRECAAGLPNFVNDLLVPGTTGIASHEEGPIAHCTVTNDGLVIQTRVNAAGTRFSIFRSDGALMEEGSMTGNNTLVPIARFAAGLFVVRVTSRDGRIATASFAIAR